MTLHIPEYYKEVSLRLNRVLDTVGLGEDIRWKRTNMLIQSEEALSMHCNQPNHYFGSQAEATTTPGLNSDIDIVLCTKMRAIKDLESWVPDVPTVLIVRDENTHPGYVKLQALYTDQPLPAYHQHHVVYISDRYGRTVLCNDYHGLKADIAYEQHGPANTQNVGTNIVDFVYAVRLHAWPDQASQWLTRNRRHNWPSQETIALIQETGVLLVPVGHKLSLEKHLEWRLSFSYGEKLLVWLFNSTQYKCYILLKMINKRFIRPIVGDDALSSYHCKTCIFYLMENTPTATWQPDNLLLCVELCLRLLYNWIESTICPNYFIPEENMFQCKVYGHTQGQLLDVISNLLRQEGRYLVGISCDNIGQKLVMTCQTPLIELELHSQDVAQALRTSVMIMLDNLEVVIQTDVANGLMSEIRALDRFISSQKARREINVISRKFSCSAIGSKLASESLSEETPDQHLLDMAQELLLWGSSSDVASGKLKLAAFYLVQDNFDMSEDVLNEIHQNYNYKISHWYTITENTLQAILSKNLSTTQLISQYVAFPVHYQLSEINCIPKALIAEMFRSPWSNEVNSDEKLVSVDPKLYLYFLEYLCHHRQNKRSHKKAALDNMISVIRHEVVEFEDTARNLLAYCLRQEGRLMNAYNILCKSMKLVKQHNAAKWQIATLINAAFRCLRGGQ